MFQNRRGEVDMLESYATYNTDLDTSISNI